MPPDTLNATGQQIDALAEEKEYLQNEIDTLTEKIENLEWLRDSYVQENPTGLESKLAECDELIAQATTDLKELQARMTRNEQNLGLQSGDEPVAAPEDIPQEYPLETPLDSPQQTSEEPTPES
jgi:chromosome segregation ATPase